MHAAWVWRGRNEWDGSGYARVRGEKQIEREENR
jgi:hypothetical protein